MCGRFACHLPPDAIRALFAIAGPAPNHAPSWNVAPTDTALVVRRHPKTGERRLDPLRWGSIPSWTTAAKPPRPINARAETAAGSPLFKAALAARRCIVPADAFYEWRTMPDGKQPYAIARRDGAPVALAGLWDRWISPAGELIRSFAILTTRANATMRPLHERMPVVLEPADWAVWLDGDAAAAAATMRPAGDAVLRLWPVSRAVNNVRNDTATLLDPVPDPQPAPSEAMPARDEPADGAQPGANPA